MIVDNYTRNAIRVSVARICQMIGWTSIHSNPIEILTDILQEYIFNLAKLAGNYATLYGQCEPNFNHLTLAFKAMGISVSELEEYVTYVESSIVVEVPKYPMPKESHLNHLKPGSREVVTRPVHIHEHLPPMHPHLEDREYALSKSPLSIDISPSDSLSPLSSPKGIFKKPGDPACNDIRRTRPLLDDSEIRPLREISSVMMTTSGFLSPAREGKLPEARTQPIEYNRTSLSPEELDLVEPNFEMKPERKKKVKLPDFVKKLDKENKIKEENHEQRETEDELKGKKLINPKDKDNLKDKAKLKALKTVAQKIPHKPPSPSLLQKKPKMLISSTACIGNLLAKQQKEKTPKTHKKPLSPSTKDIFAPSLTAHTKDIFSDVDIKLPSEPDRQKLNILKKISKVKEDHEEYPKNIVTEGRESNFFSTENMSQIMKKSSNDSNLSYKPCEVEMEIPIDVENSSPPSIMEFNRLPTPDLLKTPEMHKTTEVKKKKKDKKEKRDADSCKDVYYDFPKVKHQTDENIVKSKLSSVPAEICLPEEDTRPPAFQGLTCPVSPAPGLIPWSNPLFSNSNPTSPAMNLLNYSNFQKKSQESPTTHQQSSYSPITSSASHTTSGTAPLSPFANKDISLILAKKKERKREKKLKEKMKKKKDKKEKNRPKDKVERKKLKLEKKEKAKLKLKKDKKEKKKDKEQTSGELLHEINTVPKITFKLGPLSPKDNSAESCTRKIVIKPIVKKEDDTAAEINFEPELPKPLITSTSSTPKLKSLKGGKSFCQLKPDILDKPSSSSCTPTLSIPKPEPVSSITKWDGDSNQLWICPACNRPDDGSPMIACDLCDYWYHWICVGIQEAIENDWYCGTCTSRRAEGCSEKKKKHRKKKI